MDYEKMWDELLTEAKKDEEYQWHLEQVRSTEPDFLAVCEMLTPEQRQAVEDYIAACDAQDDYMFTLAYRLGKRTQ